MTKKYIATIVFVITALSFFQIFAVAAAACGDDISTLLETRQARIEIVKATFHEEVKGANATYKTDRPDKFRALRVTLKITKPTGAAIEVRAADIVVHYQRRESSQAATCKGLSMLSTEPDSNRPLLITNDGSLTSSTKTDSATSKAEVLYLDAVFFGMEPDVSDLRWFVAQPVAASGWK